MEFCTYILVVVAVLWNFALIFLLWLLSDGILHLYSCFGCCLMEFCTYILVVVVVLLEFCTFILVVVVVLWNYNFLSSLCHV